MFMQNILIFGFVAVCVLEIYIFFLLFPLLYFVCLSTESGKSIPAWQICFLIALWFLELIELLQHNLTQNSIDLDSCTSMQKAAQNLQIAAEKKTEGCQSSKQFLQKKLWVTVQIWSFSGQLFMSEMGKSTMSQCCMRISCRFYDLIIEKSAKARPSLHLKAMDPLDQEAVFSWSDFCPSAFF